MEFRKMILELIYVFASTLTKKEITSDSNYKQIITGTLAEFHVRDPHILNNLNIRDNSIWCLEVGAWEPGLLHLNPSSTDNNKQVLSDPCAPFFGHLWKGNYNITCFMGSQWRLSGLIHVNCLEKFRAHINFKIW